MAQENIKETLKTEKKTFSKLLTSFVKSPAAIFLPVRGQTFYHSLLNNKRAGRENSRPVIVCV